jgi:hypothetical protein
MDTKQPSELSKRQFFVLDLYRDLAVWPGVIDNAAEHVTTWDPAPQ